MVSKKVPDSELTYAEFRKLICYFCDCPECSGYRNSDIDACVDPDNY